MTGEAVDMATDLAENKGPSKDKDNKKWQRKKNERYQMDYILIETAQSEGLLKAS